MTKSALKTKDLLISEAIKFWPISACFWLDSRYFSGSK